MYVVVDWRVLLLIIGVSITIGVGGIACCLRWASKQYGEGFRDGIAERTRQYYMFERMSEHDQRLKDQQATNGV